MLVSRPLPTRALTMAIIVVLHVLLLVMFDRSMRGIPTSSEGPVAYMVLIPINSQQPPVVLAPVTSFHSTGKAIVTPDVTIDIASSQTSATNASPIIDWQAEASTVAKEAAKRASSAQYKDFNTHEPCSEADPLNKLKRECQKKTSGFAWNPAPPIAGFSGGLPYVNLGSKCTLGLGFFGCGFGKSPPPNGTLFDNLKPEYLKKPVEEICAKNMAGCNYSSSSSMH